MNTKTSDNSSPWGLSKNASLRTYCPDFHLPRKIRHYDRRSKLNLCWDMRDKTPSDTMSPSPVPNLQLQHTLGKINEVLTSIQNKSKANPKSNADDYEAPPPTTTESLSSSNTINSQIPSLETESSGLLAKETYSTSSSSRPESPDKNKSLDVSSVCDTLATASFIQKPARRFKKMHESTFSSLAEMTGCGHQNSDNVNHRKGHHPSNKSAITPKDTFVSNIKIEESDKQQRHYMEYPPQRNSTTFHGTFHDDLIVTIDEMKARGLITL